MRDRCLCKNMQKVVSEFGVQITGLVVSMAATTCEFA